MGRIRRCGGSCRFRFRLGDRRFGFGSLPHRRIFDEKTRRALPGAEQQQTRYRRIGGIVDAFYRRIGDSRIGRGYAHIHLRYDPPVSTMP